MPGVPPKSANVKAPLIYGWEDGTIAALTFSCMPSTLCVLLLPPLGPQVLHSIKAEANRQIARAGLCICHMAAACHAYPLALVVNFIYHAFGPVVYLSTSPYPCSLADLGGRTRHAPPLRIQILSF